MVLPKVQVSSYKLKRWGMEQICFYFAAGSPKKSFYRGVPDVPKLFCHGPINMAPSKEKKGKKL